MCASGATCRVFAPYMLRTRFQRVAGTDGTCSAQTPDTRLVGHVFVSIQLFVRTNSNVYMFYVRNSFVEKKEKDTYCPQAQHVSFIYAALPLCPQGGNVILLSAGRNLHHTRR